jgi:hypothetical protein
MDLQRDPQEISVTRYKGLVEDSLLGLVVSMFK